MITLISITTFTDSGSAYGFLFTSYVIGSVVAGLALGWTNPRGRAGMIMVVSLVGSGLFFLVAGLVPPVLALLGLIWLLIGFATSGYLSSKFALVSGSVDPNKLARVSSNMYLFPGITSSVGALVLGLLAGSATSHSFALVIGIGFLAAGLIAILLPGLKTLRY